MGFDVYGINAASKKGEYFRNNVWYWRPLWRYVAQVCEDILTAEDIEEGGYNDGHVIEADKAAKIAERLLSLIKDKEVRRFADEYATELETLPDEQCGHCAGTGERHDEYVDGQCNACGGKGTVRPWKTWYPFSEENVKEFAEFCRDSGGFAIG